MPFASQKTEAITFPADDTTLAFFGGEEEGCFHRGDCRLVSRSKWWTQHSSWVWNRSRKFAGSASKSAKFTRDMTSLVCFWSGVKSCGIHQAETFDIPSSLCRMFSIRSREMSTASAIWLTVKRLSWCHPSPCGEHGRYLFGWWLWQDVRTLGRLQGSPIYTPLEFSCPLLHRW